MNLRIFLAIMMAGVGATVCADPAPTFEKSLTIKPSAPKPPPWVTDLPPKASAKLTVEVVDEETVGTVKYKRKPGPVEVDITPHDNNSLIWIQNISATGTTLEFNVLNSRTAANISTTVKVACVWQAPALSGGGKGVKPPDINGLATGIANLALTGNCVWSFDRTEQLADGASLINWQLKYLDEEGNLMPMNFTEIKAVSLDPGTATWTISPGADANSPVFGTVKSQNSSVGKLEATYFKEGASQITRTQTILRFVAPQIYSDLNNDGKADSADALLANLPYKAGTTEAEKEMGTEFMFANDKLSNGIWDKDDTTTPGKPTSDQDDSVTDDDDAEAIYINPGITEGEVWLDHPAVAGMKFYKTKKCTEEIQLSPDHHFSISASNPFPDKKVFLRAENVSFTSTTNPQVEGDLKLMIKPSGGSTGIEAAKMKLTVIKDLGATKYFHGARDYIFEHNTKTFTHHKDYGGTSYRIVGMREESTVMFGLDTFDHAAGTGRLWGIDAVKANYNSDVIVNGNYVWFSGGTPSLPYLYMTDRCDGRLCVGRLILRPPSDDTHFPKYGGATGRYVGHQLDPQAFTFGAGQIPDPPNIDHGIGGLSTEYGLPIRQTKENQFIGRGKVSETGKGIVFTATNYVGKGGKAADFANDAHNSGVQPLPGGGAGEWELFHLDGSSSVGLILANPAGTQQTVIKGDKHSGWKYYVNTYLLFECEKPR